MKAKEFLDKGIKDYDVMKKAYTKQVKAMDIIIDKSIELIRAHDETNIDYMTDVGLDFWMQIYLMKNELSTMRAHIEITILKYKRMSIKDGEDKRDVKDKVELIKDVYFGELDRWNTNMYSVGTLLTMYREEIRRLTGDRRASEYVGV